MDLLKEGFWGILLNITGICLWGGTALYIIIKKVKGSRKDLTICRIRDQRNFDEEVFSQLVKQQSEKAFKRISRTINNERQLLAALLENGDLKKARDHLKSKRISKIKPKSFEDNNMKKPFPKNTERDSYAEVLRLADLGMTVRKISEMVKIPKGEIEMLITVRKRKRKIAGRRAAG